MCLLNSMILAALTAVFAADAQAGAACLPQPGQVCSVVGSIHVHARNAARLQALAVPIAAAQDQFRRHFGVAVPAGVVVDAGSVSASQRTQLMQPGLAWVLPWLDPQDHQALLRSSIRAQLKAQMPDASESEIETRLGQTLAAIPPRAAPAPAGRAGGPALMLEGALQHEIGHQLFIHAYFGGEREAAPSDAAIYGAAGAPDWLDEAAAILTEDAAMAEARRAAFARQVGEAGLSSLTPLAEYLTMAHPGMASAEVAALVERQAAAAGGEPSATEAAVIVVDDLDPAQRAGLEAEGKFYATTRVFADFLLHASDDPSVFGKLAQAANQQREMSAWLATADTGLPFRTLAALDAGWRAWVSERYLDAAGAAPAAVRTR